jgi:hypothetical protein
MPRPPRRGDAWSRLPTRPRWRNSAPPRLGRIQTLFFAALAARPRLQGRMNSQACARPAGVNQPSKLPPDSLNQPRLSLYSLAARARLPHALAPQSGGNWMPRRKRESSNLDPRCRSRIRKIPRGSAIYVPPPVPSPRGTPPSPMLLQPPPVAPYQPPAINSFSGRVTQCLYSFPLNAGLGNNPTDRDTYVRSCVNN